MLRTERNFGRWRLRVNRGSLSTTLRTDDLKKSRSHTRSRQAHLDMTIGDYSETPRTKHADRARIGARLAQAIDDSLEAGNQRTKKSHIRKIYHPTPVVNRRG